MLWGTLLQARISILRLDILPLDIIEALTSFSIDCDQLHGFTKPDRPSAQWKGVFLSVLQTQVTSQFCPDSQEQLFREVCWVVSNLTAGTHHQIQVCGDVLHCDSL